MKRVALAFAVVGTVLVVAPPAGAQYPPPDTDVEASDQTVACGGQAITITGDDWLPGSTVKFFFGGEQIGSDTVDGSGSFSASISIPDASSGEHTVTVEGTNSQGDPATESLAITCVSGGLAFTGGNVTVWMIILAALVVIGVAAVVAGRRRTRRAA